MMGKKFTIARNLKNVIILHAVKFQEKTRNGRKYLVLYTWFYNSTQMEGKAKCHKIDKGLIKR